MLPTDPKKRFKPKRKKPPSVENIYPALRELTNMKSLLEFSLCCLSVLALLFALTCFATVVAAFVLALPVAVAYFLWKAAVFLFQS